MTSLEARADRSAIPRSPGGARYATTRRRSKVILRTLRLSFGYTVMVGLAIFSLIPFFWMISTSLKSMSGVFTFPPQLFPEKALWSNYTKVFTGFPFLKYARNTAIIAVTVTFGQILTCSMAAYAFARMKFKGRDTLFLLWLGTMMIPGQVTMISTYVWFAKIGWIDSYNALIIPGVLGGIYGTFLIRQSFLTVPQDLEDAAVMDGASPLWIFRAVMIPLSKPILATYGVFTFMGAWNDFLWPLLMINTADKMTLTVGIVMMTNSRWSTDWPLMMAGTCITLIPVLILLVTLQRYFVQGITLTGLKV